MDTVTYIITLTSATHLVLLQHYYIKYYKPILQGRQRGLEGSLSIKSQ
jgi:hypothetical protein